MDWTECKDLAGIPEDASEIQALVRVGSTWEWWAVTKFQVSPQRLHLASISSTIRMFIVGPTSDVKRYRFCVRNR